MDVKIVTPQDMTVIEEYVKELNVWNSSTEDTMKEVFIAMVGYGMTAEIAINNISALNSAISNEYGE